VFFLAHLKAGGAERVMITVANYVAACGYAVSMVLVRKEGELLDNVSDKVEVIDLQSKRMLTVLPKLVKYLKNTEPDVLISTLDYANVTALIAKKIARVPTKIVIRIANTISLTFQQKKINVWLSKLLAPHTYSWANVIIAVSKGVKEDLLATISLPEDKIHVIYNPVIRDEIFKKAHQPLDHVWLKDRDVPLILCVGRLWEQKDFPNVLKALKILLSEGIETRLLILGEGPERPHLEKLIDEAGLSEYVALPGFADNPYAYMQHADVYVLASRFEGLPNALIEAMALGCPVVSTDCPSGPNEILDGGKYGYLTPVGDSLALATAIKNTLSGQTKPVDKDWLEQFSEKEVLDKYLNVLISG